MKREKRKEFFMFQKPQIDEDSQNKILLFLQKIAQCFEDFPIAHSGFCENSIASKFKQMSEKYLLKYADSHIDEFLKCFRKEREIESEYVKRHFIELRKALWFFVKKVVRQMQTDNYENEILVRQMSRLKNALTGHEDLKDAVEGTIDTISRLMENKKNQSSFHMKELKKELTFIQSEFEEMKEKLERDALTKIYNRAAIDEHLDRILALNSIESQKYILLMFDADHFKKVNDNFGHAAGDDVLVELASRAVKAFPTRQDFVARYGGEEFLILVEGATIESIRPHVLGFLKLIRSELFHTCNGDIPVTVSVGLSMLKENDTKESWLKRADDALYQSERAGRDRMSEAS